MATCLFSLREMRATAEAELIGMKRPVYQPQKPLLVAVEAYAITTTGQRSVTVEAFGFEC